MPAKAKQEKVSQVTVKLIKSPFGRIQKHIATVRGLGLRKIGDVRVLEDTPCVRGMINSIGFMLQVKE
jgi:large subunit ribosomal protein L30